MPPATAPDGHARTSFSGRNRVGLNRMRTALLAIVFFMSALVKADPSPSAGRVVSFAYGWSAGECLGYCAEELHFAGDKVDYLARSWHAPDATRAPLDDLRGELLLDRLEAKELWRLVRSVNFVNVAERLGCPDCNDGGAERLEFTTSDHTTKRILFEAGNAPAALRELTARCRQTRRIALVVREAERRASQGLAWEPVEREAFMDDLFAAPRPATTKSATGL